MSTRQPSPNTDGLSAHGRRLDRQAAAIDLTHPGLPEFVFGWNGLASASRVRLNPAPTGSGDSWIRIPWRSTRSDWTVYRPWTALAAAGWIVDLVTDTINTSTLVGGRIDGTAYQAAATYLIWAFLTTAPDGMFFGFGATLQPTATYSAAVTSGTTITLTLAGSGLNRGWRFPVGARVIIRRGVTAADAANQGTVTARTLTSLTVQLDQSSFYGAAIPNLPGDVVQVGNFAPCLAGEDSVYPGAGLAYPFRLMGRVQTEPVGQAIRLVRYIPDPWVLNALPVVTTGAAPLAALQASLIRWIPAEATEALVRMTQTHTGAPGGPAGGQTAANVNYHGNIMATPPAGQVTRDLLWIPTRGRDCSVHLVASGGGTYTFELVEYRVAGC